MNTHHLHGSAMLTAAAACWGVGTVITKEALGSVPALSLLVLQLAISVAILATVAVSKAAGNAAPLAHVGRQAALGVLNPGLAYALGIIGLTQISASLSVLLWAVEPALILVLAHIFLGDRTTAVTRWALAMAVVGVVVVVYQPGASGTVVGVVLVLAGVLACAIYTVVARVIVADQDALPVVIVQQLAALVFAIALLGIAQLAGFDQARLSGYSMDTWLAVAASGSLYYGFAFWLYLSGLRRTSASFAGSFITLVPVFGLAAAAVVGETLAARQWFGAALVVGAVAVIVLSHGADAGSRKADQVRTDGRLSQKPR